MNSGGRRRRYHCHLRHTNSNVIEVDLLRTYGFNDEPPLNGLTQVDTILTFYSEITQTVILRLPLNNVVNPN